jgi:hypothetical protein
LLNNLLYEIKKKNRRIYIMDKKLQSLAENIKQSGALKPELLKEEKYYDRPFTQAQILNILESVGVDTFKYSFDFLAKEFGIRGIINEAKGPANFFMPLALAGSLLSGGHAINTANQIAPVAQQVQADHVAEYDAALDKALADRAALFSDLLNRYKEELPSQRGMPSEWYNRQKEYIDNYFSTLADAKPGEHTVVARGKPNTFIPNNSPLGNPLFYNVSLANLKPGGLYDVSLPKITKLDKANSPDDYYSSDMARITDEDHEAVAAEGQKKANQAVAPLKKTQDAATAASVGLGLWGLGSKVKSKEEQLGLEESTDLKSQPKVKTYTTKELKYIFESLGLDTHKYTTKFLAEKAGFKKAKKAGSKSQKAIAPIALSEQSVLELLKAGNFNLEKYNLEFLAEELGFKQGLNESNGRKTYLIEANSLGAMARKFGISVAALLSALGIATNSSAPIQQTAAPTQAVDRGNDEAAISSDVELPRASTWAEYINLSNQSKKMNDELLSKIKNAGGKYLGQYGWENAVSLGNTPTYYARQTTMLDPKSPIFTDPNISDERRQDILQMLNTYYFTPDSAKESEKYGVDFKDVDGDENVDVVSGLHSNGMFSPHQGITQRSVLSIPGTDPVTGLPKEEISSYLQGGGAAGHGKYDEFGKFGNTKPLMKYNQQTKKWEMRDNSEVDYDDGSVFYFPQGMNNDQSEAIKNILMNYNLNDPEYYRDDNPNFYGSAGLPPVARTHELVSGNPVLKNYIQARVDAGDTNLTMDDLSRDGQNKGLTGIKAAPQVPSNDQAVKPVEKPEQEENATKEPIKESVEFSKWSSRKK